MPAEQQLSMRGVPPEVRIGASSWAFPGWAGIVYGGSYPPARLSSQGLETYARHPLFRCVGLDRTYYAPMRREALARHAGQVPADFRFVAKADRRLTTPLWDSGGGNAYLDLARAAAWCVEPLAEGLRDKLGAIVFQFSPSVPARRADRERFAARLHAFLDGLPRGLPYAVELRRPWLVCDDVRNALRDGGAVPVFTVHPSAAPLAEQVEGFGLEGWPFLVVRWMLRRDRGYDAARAEFSPFDRLRAPDPEARSHIAALCRRAAEGGVAVFVAINNKAEGCAPLSALALARELAAPPLGRG